MHAPPEPKKPKLLDALSRSKGPASDDVIIEPGTTTFDVCNPISETTTPSTSIPYHLFVESLSPRWSLAADKVPKLGGNRLETDSFRLTFAADVEIRQTWRLQKLSRSDIASTLPLAPGETLTFRLVRSQRTQLDRKTMDSKEDMRSLESTTSDKEVMEATRNVTKSEGFHVNASVGVTIDVVTADIGAGFESNVQTQAQSSLQQVREATEKAARQLKTLSKIEITEVTESTQVDEQHRTLTNPYRDRSLLLVVYELLKHYHVRHEVSKLRPVLMLDSALAFDQDFVLNNVDFLTAALLDRQLAGDLPVVLSTQTDPIELADHTQRVGEMIDLAFYFLFRAPNEYFLFEDENIENFDIAAAFDAHRDPSAWSDAQGKQGANQLFLTLLTFYRIWSTLEGIGPAPGFPPDANMPRPSDAGTMKIDLFRALAKELRTQWALILPGDLVGLLDSRDRTEPFRRIPGFLAIADNFVLPLLGDRDNTSRYSNDPIDKRPAFVLARVIAHLNCFQSYYTERFYEYLHSATAGHALRKLYRDAITDLLGGLDATWRRELLEHFDPRQGFLQGTRFIIPFRGSGGDEVIAAAFGLATDPDGTGLAFKLPTIDTLVEIPADGAAIEPSVGHCVLSDVPPPPCCDEHVSTDGESTE